jgi:hypothetical protein
MFELFEPAPPNYLFAARPAGYGVFCKCRIQKSEQPVPGFRTRFVRTRFQNGDQRLREARRICQVELGHVRQIPKRCEPNRRRDRLAPIKAFPARNPAAAVDSDRPNLGDPAVRANRGIRVFVCPPQSIVHCLPSHTDKLGNLGESASLGAQSAYQIMAVPTWFTSSTHQHHTLSWERACVAEIVVHLMKRCRAGKRLRAVFKRAKCRRIV